jgi:hypothetical protein
MHVGNVIYQCFLQKFQFCSIYLKYLKVQISTVTNASSHMIIYYSIQPLGQFGHEPEPSQATGMALVRCILGKFLGVVCHCFPPCLDLPTCAARCLHVRNDARDPSSERWNYGRERLSSNFAYRASLFTPLGVFYMPYIYDMGPTALLPLRRKACWGFFRP